MRSCNVHSWCRRHPDLLALTGMAVVALTLMSPYLFRADVIPWPRSGLGTDLLNYRWAHVYHLRRSMQQHGQVPLWRGTSMGGEPMIGNPTVMVFYPLQLLMALVPVPILPGLVFLTAVHLWIAGAGAYVLARHAAGVGRLAALVSAVAMMLTPRLSSNAVGDVGLDYAMCWVPFCLAWARLALEQRRVSWAILSAVGLAFQYLLHVHIFLYTAWVIGLCLLHQIGLAVLSPRRRVGGGGVIAQAGLVGLIALVCAGLVAFELLPFVSYLPHLSRESMTLTEANAYALPPFMLISVFMPSPLLFTEWELYVGLLPLALLPFAALHRHRGEIGFWTGLAVFAALFSLGSATPLFTFLFRHVPGFDWLRVPVRMWLMVALSEAMLAGLGVDVLARWHSRAVRGHRWRHWIVLGGWTLALGTVVGRWVTRRSGNPDWLLGFVGAAGLVLGLVGVWLWMAGRVRFRAVGVMLVGGLLLDLLPVDAAYMMPMPAARAFEMPPVGQSLLDPQNRAGGPFRIYSIRGEIPSHVAAREGLEIIDGINSFQSARYVAFVKRASGCDLPGFAASVPPCITNEVSPTAYRRAIPDPALLGLINVRYVAAPFRLEGSGWALHDASAGAFLYENRHVQPRAFGVGRVQAVTSESELWQRLAEIDPSTTALVEGQVSWPLPTEPFHVPAEIVDLWPNTIQVEVELPGDGMLILGEVWTPGWRATDNGMPAQILRVDGALRGVHLSSGRHQVVFTFLPPTLIWGLCITAFSLIVCIAALFWDARRKTLLLPKPAD